MSETLKSLFFYYFLSYLFIFNSNIFVNSPLPVVFPPVGSPPPPLFSIIYLRFKSFSFLIINSNFLN